MAKTNARAPSRFMQFTPGWLWNLLPLIDDDLGRFVEVERGRRRLRTERLPDVHLVLAEFLMILVDGDLRVPGSSRSLKVAAQHPVQLVFLKGKAGHFMQPHPGVWRGVRVQPIEHSGDVVGPELPLHPERGGPGKPARQLRVVTRSVRMIPSGRNQRRREQERGQQSG